MFPYGGGSIIYCDPPYEGTSNQYGTEFDHKAFYDWAYSQPAPVFFSSYEISDDRFLAVWQKQKTVLSTAKGGGLYATEYIYANAAALAALSERKENHEQTMLPESVP